MIQKFYNKLSEQEKKIFYIAVGVGVLALFDLLFLRPVTSRLSVIDQEISEKEIGMKRDLRFLGYQDRILNEMKAYESYYAKEAQSPDQIRAEFLQQIEKLATGSKVNLTKISPSGEQERKGFIEYYADLECDGLFDNVVSFMHQVDSTKDLLKIVKMNLTGRAAGSRDVSAVMKVVKVILDPKAVWVQAELVEQLKSAKPSEPKGAGSADPARDLDKKSAGSGARAGASGSVPEEKGSAEGAAGKGASAQAGGASAGGAAGGKEGAGSGGGGSGGDGGQRALKGKGEGVGVAGGGGSGGGGGAAGAGASGSGGGGSGGGGGAAGSGASGSGGGGSGGGGGAAGSGASGSGGGGSGGAGGAAGSGASGSGGGGSGGAGGAAGAGASVSGGSDTGGGGRSGSGSGGGGGSGNVGGSAGGGGYGNDSGGSSGDSDSGQDFGVGKSFDDINSEDYAVRKEKPPAVQTEQEQRAASSKYQIPEQGSGRARMKGDLKDLWNNFWGIKPKEKAPSKPIKQKDVNWDDFEEAKPNVWERILSPQKKQ